MATPTSGPLSIALAGRCAGCAYAGDAPEESAGNALGSAAVPMRIEVFRELTDAI